MKPFKTIDEQIQILKGRNLIINNDFFAKEALLFHNYYKIINGYDDIFILPNSSPKIYKYNVHFGQIHSVFAFDYELRTLTLDSLTVIENKLKSLISYEHAKSYGPTGYLSLSSFNQSEHVKPTPTKQDLWNTKRNSSNLIAKLHQELARNLSKPYIKKALIEDEAVPIWSFVGVLSFGVLRNFYENMKELDRIIIADYFKVTANELRSFLQLLNVARNLCAHNERIYCLNADKVDIPVEKYLTLLNYRHARNNYFSLMICFKHLLSPPSFEKFFNDFSSLLDKYRIKKDSFSEDSLLSPKQFLDLKLQLGLPPNWEDLKNL